MVLSSSESKLPSGIQEVADICEVQPGLHGELCHVCTEACEAHLCLLFVVLTELQAPFAVLLYVFCNILVLQVPYVCTLQATWSVSSARGMQAAA